MYTNHKTEILTENIYLPGINGKSRKFNSNVSNGK